MHERFFSAGLLFLGAVLGVLAAVNSQLLLVLGVAAVVCFVAGAALWWRDRHRVEAVPPAPTPPPTPERIVPAAIRLPRTATMDGVYIEGYEQAIDGAHSEHVAMRNVQAIAPKPREPKDDR
jgi:hypothetical protein